MSIIRRSSRAVRLGSVTIGAASRIAIQSMTNTAAEDFEKTLEQIRRLEACGCDVVRVAVPSEAAAEIFTLAKSSGVKLPLVADIHFDYKIALAAVRCGADKIRINPGNIGAPWKVAEVAAACRDADIPIRIGVNGGSLDPKIRKKFGGTSPEALAESALSQAEILEGFGFSDIVLSLKASSVVNTIAANRIVAKVSEYPLHLGVTEAGDEYSGLIKNSAGIGALLADGIGDTVRISLTAAPKREVLAARELLSVMGLTDAGIEVVSCPTCGRTKIDLITLAAEFKKEALKLDTRGKKLKVAVMGCVVNGPGEAKDADVGIAGGDGFAVMFKHGETVGRVEEDQIITALLDECKKLIEADA